MGKRIHAVKPLCLQSKHQERYSYKILCQEEKTASTQNSVATGAPQQSQLPKEKHTENWEVTTLLHLPRPFCNTSTTTQDMRKMTDKKDFETGSHENLEGENRAQLAFFTTVRFGGLSAFSWSDYMQAET